MAFCARRNCSFSNALNPVDGSGSTWDGLCCEPSLDRRPAIIFALCESERAGLVLSTDSARAGTEFTHAAATGLATLAEPAVGSSEVDATTESSGLSSGSRCGPEAAADDIDDADDDANATTDDDDDDDDDDEDDDDDDDDDDNNDDDAQRPSISANSAFPINGFARLAVGST